MRTRTRILLCTVSTCWFVQLAACDNFLTVRNRSSLDVSDVDPARDAVTLSLSSLQDLASIFGSIVMYIGWFTGETYPTDTTGDPNNFARRDLPLGGGVATVFSGLQRALVSAKAASAALSSSPTGAKSADLARVHMVAGYSFLYLGEQFCQGTVAGGPLISSEQLIDSAVAYFTSAIDVSKAAGASASAFLNASYVGRARAYLQNGNKTAAIADATLVPAGFTYNLSYSDDLANRSRLGNTVWDRTGGSRASITVAPAYRNLNDPRVVALPPGQHPFIPQDGVTPYFLQQKHPSFGAAIRLASKVEADYIAAEAQGTSAQLALIAARRPANNQPAYTGPTDAASVLAEFENQRAREFYLEGKRLGDLRRNGAAVLNVPEPGATYFKPGYDTIKGLTCYPLPSAEITNNPNIPRG